MKLHFDPNQDFQAKAVKAVADIFEGQPLSSGDFEYPLKENFLLNGVANNITLSEEQLLKNVQKVQKDNGLAIGEKLEGMHFSIEMETGTGKTYVYLRTIYELNKIYGFKKFVIVVPSIAIREGVLKNLQITHEHFQGLYNNAPVSFLVYDSKRVSVLRSFATSNTVQILVLNIDSFAKDENVINRPNDKLTGQCPIEFIQTTQPIVIVDEPQNMETDIRKAAVERLRPICTLRYSATHTNVYNLVYSLNPVQAYDMGLVKQIEVDSVITDENFNVPFISVESFHSTKTKTSAKILVDVNTNNGVQRKLVTVDRDKSDLFKISGERDLYRDLHVNEIDVQAEMITLSNGTMLYKGDKQGGMTDEVMKVQIEKTIEEHLKKEKEYKDKNIKVLSLFFIDKVANYRSYKDGVPVKGKFALWFEELFKKYSEKQAYRGLINASVGNVHNGYFAQDKNGIWKDTGSAERSQEGEDALRAYELIMKEKERLLDVNEPLRFIFSHSALKEGWDNPNVCQICTLNETKSELKKRQEIGRGLRLVVNQEGDRIFDRKYNRLTVIANESYKDFAKQLQTEIEDDCGVAFEGRIKNKRDRVTVKYRKGFQLDERFIGIWERIKAQTTYRIEYQSEDLIRDASKAIREMAPIHRPVIHSTKTGVIILAGGIEGKILGETRNELYSLRMEIPDVLSYVQSKTELTRITIKSILEKSGRLKDILINPQMFLDYAVSAIRFVLNQIMIDGIKYIKVGGKEYEMRLFEENEIETYLNDLIFKVKNNDKTIYEELMPLESTPEMNFAGECETREDVEFYFKLPFWFKIQTPIGEYNPDWAVVLKGDKKVYFVAETKSTLNLNELRLEEKMKIKCGYAHFKEFASEGVVYKHATKVSDLA